MSKINLTCKGGEEGKCLSYLNNQLSLQKTDQTIENQFILKTIENKPDIVSFLCLGISNTYLSHSNGSLSLRNGNPTENEMFKIHNKDYSFGFECCGQNKGNFLSHCFDKVGLQNGYQGDGESFDIKHLF